MHGYVSGEQPAASERVVKLNMNETAFPPSPRVLEAIRNVEPDRLRVYPPAKANEFRQVAATHHGLAVENVLAGNGSDDVLTVLTRTYVGVGGVVASPWPTYSLYPVLCDIQGATYTKVPWRDDWALPTEALLATRPAAIYLANPNAPSGTLVASSELADLAGRFDGLLLVDEAYVDFAETDCVGLLKEHENVVVTRTLSKGYGLAGLRFGYALAHAAVVEEMMKVKDSHNADILSQAAAVAALRDQEYARTIWRHVREERGRLTIELQLMGFKLPRSHANFVLARHDAHPDAGDLYRGLRKQGVLVRHWDSPELRPFLRITVGTAQENNAVLAALATLV